MNIAGLNLLENGFVFSKVLIDNPITRVAQDAIEDFTETLESFCESAFSSVQVILDVAEEGAAFGCELISWVVLSVRSAIAYLCNMIFHQGCEAVGSLRGGGVRRSASRALNNPGNNCFMNASFQSFFANADRRAWVRECLTTISEGGGPEVRPFDCALAYWKDHATVLEQDWKEDFRGQEGKVGDYLRISFRQAAK